MLLASELATSGSVMQNAERISPSSSGLEPASRWSSSANMSSNSMLPVSGAAQLSASGAIERAPSRDLGEGRVLLVGQSGAVRTVRKKQVP